MLADLFESWLRELPVAEPGSLADIAAYTLFLPGKRLRPVLALASGELLGIELSRLRPLALALEYLHVYSLIHDDLPALDNDALRRGMPTAHIKFGEAEAVLAGDWLHAQVFSTLALAEDFGDEAGRAISGLISRVSAELCEGQLMDLRASELSDSTAALELLERRHLLKTGALIRAAVSAPALLLSRDEQDGVYTALDTYGKHLGLLFQITDDILDVCSSTSKTGKPTASDERQGTPTYVSVYGVARAKELAAACASDAQSAIQQFGKQAEFLQLLSGLMLNRER
jgi:geranylgeranyl pyrophosphate synthase